MPQDIIEYSESVGDQVAYTTCCTVNMAAAGLYSVGGAFWEFSEPDWEHAKLFLMIVRNVIP